MTEKDKKSSQPAGRTAAEKPAVTVVAPAMAPAEVAPQAMPATQPAPKVAGKAVPPVAKKAPASAATARVRRAQQTRKPTQVEQTVARNQKILAEELVKAQAINYEQPKVMKQPVAAKKAAKEVAKEAGKASEKAAAKASAKLAAREAKAVKPAKAKKPRLVRDSYAMPEVEYAQIAMLKKRLAALGREARKSELLRGGIAALAAFNDDELKAVMGRIERIKTGRPAKK